MNVEGIEGGGRVEMYYVCRMECLRGQDLQF